MRHLGTNTKKKADFRRSLRSQLRHELDEVHIDETLGALEQHGHRTARLLVRVVLANAVQLPGDIVAAADIAIRAGDRHRGRIVDLGVLDRGNALRLDSLHGLAGMVREIALHRPGGVTQGRGQLLHRQRAPRLRMLGQQRLDALETSAYVFQQSQAGFDIRVANSVDSGFDQARLGRLFIRAGRYLSRRDLDIAQTYGSEHRRADQWRKPDLAQDAIHVIQRNQNVEPLHGIVVLVEHGMHMIPITLDAGFDEREPVGQAGKAMLAYQHAHQPHGQAQIAGTRKQFQHERLDQLPIGTGCLDAHAAVLDGRRALHEPRQLDIVSVVLQIRTAWLLGGYVLQILGQLYGRQPWSGVPRIARKSSMCARGHGGLGLQGAVMDGALSGKNIDIRHDNVSLDCSWWAFDWGCINAKRFASIQRCGLREAHPVGCTPTDETLRAVPRIKNRRNLRRAKELPSPISRSAFAGVCFLFRRGILYAMTDARTATNPLLASDGSAMFERHLPMDGTASSYWITPGFSARHPCPRRYVYAWVGTANLAPDRTGLTKMTETAIQAAQDKAKLAHMRLARNQVLGMRDYVDDRTNYRHAAAERIQEICNVPASQAPRVLDAMISVLTHGRLTINFCAANFFLEVNRSDTYSNCFERSVANRDKESYLEKRNNIEKKLFDYPGDSARYVRGSGMSSAHRRYANPRSAREEIAYHATRSPNWAMMRPRYGALDFGHCIHGGASLGDYGKSFFVLRGHMKTAATYTATDTFSVAEDLKRRRAQYGGIAPTTHQVAARLHEMEKIIYYAHPGMVRQIYAYGMRLKQRGSEAAINWHLPGHLTLNYIEAQLHADLSFERDVEYMFLCASEINVARGPSYNHHEVHKHAEMFARRHGLTLRYQ